MAVSPVTVVVNTDGQHRKLCKIWFGKDGTYYVSMPYHKARTAYLHKCINDYSLGYRQARVVAESEFIDSASLDDDKNALKLSHHASGFCQFSGPGVVSGIDEDGGIRGMGVFSRALEAVGDGPAFGLLAYGLHDFAQAETPLQNAIIVNFDSLLQSNQVDANENLEWKESEDTRSALMLEGFYFQPWVRRFVEIDEQGLPFLLYQHPSTFLMKLAVVLPQELCELDGFLGLHTYRIATTQPSESGFSMSGPGGNAREDSLGRPIADGIYCMFPRPHGFSPNRDLNYHQGNSNKKVGDTSESSL